METEQFTGASSVMKGDTPWLASEDIIDAGDVIVEIEGIYLHRDAVFDDGRKEDVYALGFVGKKKHLILNATNRQRIVKLTGTGKTASWIGQVIALYVEYGIRKPGGVKGETTCGIRIREKVPVQEK
jgi:hypothetical protein